MAELDEPAYQPQGIENLTPRARQQLHEMLMKDAEQIRKEVAILIRIARYANDQEVVALLTKPFSDKEIDEVLQPPT